MSRDAPIHGEKVGLDDIRAAQDRIRGLVRRTPLVEAHALKNDPVAGAHLLFKLENLQATGSFKPRGATSKLTTLSAAAKKRGLITASGGNHGLAVAYAGWIAGVPATIYLPESTPRAKAEKLEQWDADVVVEGAVWDDANTVAMDRAERAGLTYLHPFADPAVIAGQGTCGLEILEQDPAIDMLVVAIGGGGLIAGIATAAKALKPGIEVIGVEPTGAPTLSESLKAGDLVTLPEIATDAGTLAPRRSAPINLDIVRRKVGDIALVTDDEMRAAARWLWFEFGLATELAGAASVAALMTGRIDVPKGARVCALICGAGVDGFR